jgi:hypothetical protein
MPILPQFQSMVDSLGASVTQYIPLAICAGLFTATEGDKQVIYRSPGRITGLYMRIATNTNGASTATLRKNTAVGNNTLSIGASATGEFEDTTHSDTIAAGDKLALQVVTGAGGSTSPTIVRTLFSPSGDWTPRCCSNDNSGNPAASQQNFAFFAGQLAYTPTESNRYELMRLPATLKNLMVYIPTNTINAATTFGSRKNSANGNLTLSVGASTTGFFEDTTNSDALVLNDLVNTFITMGAFTSGAMGINQVAVDLVTTNYISYLFSDVFNGATVLKATTTNFPIAGNMTANATESQIQGKVGVECYIQSLRIYVSANANTVADTFTLRINAANGTITVSIGASTSGSFEDLTHSDHIKPTDEVNFQIITGSSSGGAKNITLQNTKVSVTIPALPDSYMPTTEQPMLQKPELVAY